MITVEESRCKSCGICLEACPLTLLEVTDQISSKGYRIVGLTDQKKCSSCGVCALVCPDAAIEVYRTE